MWYVSVSLMGGFNKSQHIQSMQMYITDSVANHCCNYPNQLHVI